MSDTYTLGTSPASTRRPPVVPVRGTELARREMLASHPELLAAGELQQTTDELRLWRGDTLIGPVVDHGTFADEAALAAWYLSPSCTRGVHAGDTAYVTASGCAYSVASGHAATATWRRSSAAAGLVESEASARAAADNAHNTATDSHTDLRTALAGKWSTPTNAAALGDITRSEANAPLWRGAAWPGAGDSQFSESTAPPQIEAELAWSSDGDANGAFYSLGAPGGIAWANPQSTSVVKGLASSLYSGSSMLNLTDREASNTISQEGANNWFAFDFGEARLAIDSYSLRGRSTYADHQLRSWKIQGTNSIPVWSVSEVSAATWTDIDTRSADSTLTQSTWGHWSAPSRSSSFRYVRLLLNGVDSSGSYYLGLGEIEFYGLIVLPQIILPVSARGWLADGSGHYIPYY